MFASYSNEICKAGSFYLSSEDLLQEPDEVKNATPVPDMLKTHKVVRGKRKHGVPLNRFFYLSVDEIPHFTQWYGMECGHESR